MCIINSINVDHLYYILIIFIGNVIEIIVDRRILYYYIPLHYLLMKFTSSSLY